MEMRSVICGLAAAGMRRSEIVATLKVAHSTVQRTLKKKNAGKLLEYDSTSKKKTKLTLRVAAGLRRRNNCAPTKSPQQVAAEAGQSRELVRRLVKLLGCLLSVRLAEKSGKIGPTAF